MQMQSRLLMNVAVRKMFVSASAWLEQSFVMRWFIIPISVNSITLSTLALILKREKNLFFSKSGDMPLTLPVV